MTIVDPFLFLVGVIIGWVIVVVLVTVAILLDFIKIRQDKG